MILIAIQIGHFFSFWTSVSCKWHGFLWLRLPVLLLFGSKNCIIFLAYSWMHLEFYISHEFECYFFFLSLKTSALSYSWRLSINEIIRVYIIALKMSEFFFNLPLLFSAVNRPGIFKILYFIFFVWISSFSRWKCGRNFKNISTILYPYFYRHQLDWIALENIILLQMQKKKNYLGIMIFRKIQNLFLQSQEWNIRNCKMLDKFKKS